MGSAVTPSPLVGEGWGGGIARHSQIKGLFFKWIQRRAPLPNPSPRGGRGSAASYKIHCRARQAVYLERLEVDGRVAVVIPGAYWVALFAMYHNLVKVYRR